MFAVINPWWLALVGVAVVVLGIWLPGRIDYQITKRHLRITFFGLPVRWVSLANIEHVTKRHRRWAEPWWNTLRPFRRRLMIRRRHGLIRNLVITPMYRYEFKAELEAAARQAQAGTGTKLTTLAEEEPESTSASST